MKQIRKTLKYRLYQSKNDRVLHSTIDACADIWNYALSFQKRYYEWFGRYISLYRLQKFIAKKRNQNPLWKLVGSQAVQETIGRLDLAYKRFFKWCKHKSGKIVRPPKFKRRRKYSSFTLKQAGWKLQDQANKIKIGKKIYKFVLTREIQGQIKTVTIKRDRLGSLWICFSVIQELDIVQSRVGNSIGADFGLKDFLVLSDGRSVSNPQFLKASLNRLRKLHRNLSRKKKFSKNWFKAMKTLSKQYQKITDQRRDWQFKTANTLLDQTDVVYLEDLDLESMKSRWGRKVSDVSFGTFVTVLEHLAKLRGKRVIKVDRFFPSTKMCSSCKFIQDMPIEKRQYDCPNCGFSLSRDVNAAINIKAEGIRLGLDTVRLALPAGVA